MNMAKRKNEQRTKAAMKDAVQVISMIKQLIANWEAEHGKIPELKDL